MIFHLLALKRSGHHAIGNWIFCQVDPPIEYPGFNPHHQGHGITYQTSKDSVSLTFKNPQCFLSADDRTITRRMQIMNTFKDQHIRINTERAIRTTLEDTNQWIPNLDMLILDMPTIVVMRDCYNNLASACKLYRFYAKRRNKNNSVKSIIQIRDVWKKQAKKYLTDKNGLYFILYNSWVSNKDYRKQICNDLDLHFTDIGHEFVPANAGGSSFDSTRLQKKASNMKVNNRYKSYLNNDKFVQLFDKEIIELNQQIFNMESPF